MNISKRAGGIILALVILLSDILMLSCESDPKINAGETNQENTSQPDEEEGLKYPYELGDYDGFVFTVLNQEDDFWSGTTHVLDFESETGDPVNDSIYRRNREAEDSLNIKIEIVKDVIDNNSMRKKMEQSVIANEDAYSAVYLPLNYGNATSFTGEYTLNLHSIDTLRLTEPWWNQVFIESATVGDNLLYTSIDNFNLMSVAWCNMLLFNITMFQNYSYDMPYDAVRNGAWTYDMMYSLMSNVVNINGDDNWSAKTDGNCVYGFATEHGGGILSLLSGSGEFLVNLGEDRIPELDIGNERLFNAYDSLLTALSQPGWCLLQNTAELQATDIFVQGRALFTPATLGSTLGKRLRGADTVYGIVPLPKADEQQSSYCMSESQYTLALNIPKTVSDPEKVGAVIDYLSYLSYANIIPILNVSFCYKGVRDDDSIEMIEIIQSTQTVDIGNLYGWTTDILNILCSDITKGNNNFVSMLAKNEETIIARINDTFNK